MGLRSPQEMQKVKTAQEGTGRFQGVHPPQIDTTFLGTLGKAAGVKEDQRRVQEKANQKFVIARADNMAEAARIEAQAKLSDARGMDALDVHEEVKKDLADKFQEIKGTFPEDYHGLITDRLANKYNQFQSFAIPHVAGQVVKVKEDTLDEYVANGVNAGAEHSGDDQFFSNVSLPAVREAAILRAQQTYGVNPNNVIHKDPQGNPITAGDMHKQMADEAESLTIKTAVNAQANGGSLEKAQRIYDTHQQKMSEKDRIEANKILDHARNSANNSEASAKAKQVTDYLALHPNEYINAESMVSKLASDDKQRPLIQRFVDDHIKMVKLQKEATSNSSLSALSKGMAKGKSLTSPDMAPHLEYLQMNDDKAYKSFMKYAATTDGKGDFPSDPEAYNTLNKLVYGATRIDDLPGGKNFDIKAQGMGINARDLKPMEAQVNRLRMQEGDIALKAQMASATTINSRMLSKLDEHKIYNTQLRGQAMSLGHQVFEQIQHENPRMPLNQIESKVIAEIERNGFFKKEVPRYPILGRFSPTKEKEVPNPGVVKTNKAPHQSWIDGARKILKDKATPENIEKFMKTAILKGYKINEPRK